MQYDKGRSVLRDPEDVSNSKAGALNTQVEPLRGKVQSQQDEANALRGVLHTRRKKKQPTSRNLDTRKQHFMRTDAKLAESEDACERVGEATAGCP